MKALPRVAISAGGALAYLLVYPTIYAATGPLARLAIAMPAALAGALLGRNRGLAAGLALTLAQLLLDALLGLTPAISLHTQSLTVALALLAGGGAGWMRDLYDAVRRQARDLETERTRLQEQIAERRQVEQSLRLLEKALQTMNLGVTISNPEGTIVYVNPAEARMHGYTVSEMIGQSARMLAPRDRWRPIQAGERAQWQSWQRESVNIRKDGSIFPVQLFSDVVKDSDGQLIGVVTSCLDITERKAAEEQLHRSNEELEDRVRARTAELTQVNAELLLEIAERKCIEQRLQASLAEKVVLLKEIHHRVKNNLQVVSSLFSLQSAYVQDAASLEILRESQNRVRSMALIHEKLYQSEDLASVNFGIYVRDLTNYLFRSYKSRASAVRLQLDVAPDVRLPIDSAIPCGLIVNELVSNSLKHAFPDGRAGEVRVTLERAGDGRVALIVGDDGIGLPAGLDVRNSSSMGLQLVSTLIDQLDAEMRVKNAAGTEWRIVFAEHTRPHVRGTGGTPEPQAAAAGSSK